MIALLAVLSFAAQDEAKAPPTPYDRVVELELTPEPPGPIEGGGPTLVAEYEVAFGGTLHVWTESELDLSLQLEEALEGTLRLSDDDSGGDTSPYLRLEVRDGGRVVVRVSTEADTGGALTLHWTAAPETGESRAGSANGRKELQEAVRLLAAGERQAARDSTGRIVAELLAIPGCYHSHAIAELLFEAGEFAYTQLGDLATAKAAWHAARRYRERALPPDHVDLSIARANLAVVLDESGELAAARTLREVVLATRERTLPPDHPAILAARTDLGISLHRTGELDRALALQESVVAGFERTVPADHPELQRARINLAAALHGAGELTAARDMQASALAVYERTLAADHPFLLLAQSGLAVMLKDTGDFDGALALQESVLAAHEATLPEDHPTLLRSRMNLAATLGRMGEVSRAVAQQEAVLRAYERTLDELHPDLLAAREGLAQALSAIGKFDAARLQYELAANGYERSLPEGHPDRLRARANLAVALWRIGDLVGARVLQESVLGAYESKWSADHPYVQVLRANLATTLAAMGEEEQALELQAAVLEVRERTLPPDHPDTLVARANVATLLFRLGDAAGARELQESVLAVYARTLPEDHPDLLLLRENLAVSLRETGELGAARSLHESALAEYQRTLPSDHPTLLRARMQLAVSLHQMGEVSRSHEQLPALMSGISSRALAALASAPRETQSTVLSEDHALAVVFLLTEDAGADLMRRAFELTETLRLVAAEAARVLTRIDADAELAPILKEVAAVRRALNELVAGAAAGGARGEGFSSELTSLSLERDRLERAATRRLVESGVVARPVDTTELVTRLDEADLFVGYRRTVQWHVDEETGKAEPASERLISHVLRADGELARLDLGRTDELERMIAAWRSSLGAPLAARSGDAAMRGVAVDELPAGVEEELGGELRARLLDPVLAFAPPEVRRVFLCADDLLFLLPLDALPAGAPGGRVGDRLTLLNEVSLARLISFPTARAAGEGFVVLGGVDYRGEASGASDAELDRSARSGEFASLPASRSEAQATARLFEQAFGTEAVSLLGTRADRANLFAIAPGKRYVHLATHGWFAPEDIRSIKDTSAVANGMGLEERVAGLAPMTLCGLALAGANRGGDSVGRVPGILTAEELCSLDLSRCELAVLSACETNVGIRRAGQGIQSLQAALYAAGARTSITSLWKVDDAATRRLFEVFYTNLWIEEMPKAEALWQAKCSLREEGHPVRDWAGWVLTGDPD